MNRPPVLGHRGASAAAPENTLAAFRLARQTGANGVELDVRLSRDGVPVVIHDDTVDRTTNGHGRVSDLTVLELRQLDAGSWKGFEFANEQIPLLAEVFQELEDWLRPLTPKFGPAGFVNVELKADSLTGTGLEREVVNLIVQMNLESRVIISSFNPLALARVRALNPQIKRGLLCSADLPVFLSRVWFRWLAAPHALHPEYHMINEEYMRWALQKHIPINAWTVDDPAEARRLAQAGVNALITNRPDVICRALK